MKSNELGSSRNPANIAQAIMLFAKVSVVVFDAACHVAIQYKKTREELKKQRGTLALQKRNLCSRFLI